MDTSSKVVMDAPCGLQGGTHALPDAIDCDTDGNVFVTIAGARSLAGKIAPGESLTTHGVTVRMPVEGLPEMSWICLTGA